MSFRVKIKADNKDEAIRILNQRVETALEAAGIFIEVQAKKNSPVDTGNLRNSITHETEGNTTNIGSNVEYAPYVEMGTSRHSAQPFLAPAINDNLSKIESIIKQYLSE